MRLINLSSKYLPYHHLEIEASLEIKVFAELVTNRNVSEQWYVAHKAHKDPSAPTYALCACVVESQYILFSYIT